MDEECISCNGGDFAQLTRDNINKYGLSIVGTQYELADDTIPMTYSIGITETTKKPEIIIFGIPTKYAKTFINMYMAKIKDGFKFEMGKEYDDFAEGYPMQLKEISLKSYNDYLIQAEAFNTQNTNALKAVQMIYPDADGNWPWDSENEHFIKIAKILD
jgi:hypothetical protein